MKMAFNPNQFKQKKKREVDPNAPPRPNLMSHDKTIREGQAAFNQLEDRVRKQAEEIETLKSNYRDLQQGMNQLINLVRRK
jgi:DNA-binding transcriptional regulator GbsR (MarR family)